MAIMEINNFDNISTLTIHETHEIYVHPYIIYKSAKLYEAILIKTTSSLIAPSNFNNGNDTLHKSLYFYYSNNFYHIKYFSIYNGIQNIYIQELIQKLLLVTIEPNELMSTIYELELIYKREFLREFNQWKDYLTISIPFEQIESSKKFPITII